MAVILDKSTLSRSLSVNLDHMATLRQVRQTNYPSLTTAAGICEVAGADGVTLHLREDRRHIQDRDLELLRETSLLPITLEMGSTPEMLAIALKTRPHAVTLVPERRQELTTEGGLDAVGLEKQLVPVVSDLKSKGIVVCLFLEPDVDQIQKAHSLGCDSVELHTGAYALDWEQSRTQAIEKHLSRIEIAVKKGTELGLQMNAGHGLHYQNIRPLAALKGLTEFSIGHSIICRSLFVGLEKAVREMADLIREKG
ncbi:MAG: pyridoxine 5'-phosphate synthase [Spirochaetaceae bacterium]|nr:pyridoxine 5'-phosphate synthase [Spirochaetaceae bacterium]|tara:strand:+ start:4094 stop:4855 length:762 start_codon:yes stop_codon:yes gene_type:complete